MPTSQSVKVLAQIDVGICFTQVSLWWNFHIVAANSLRCSRTARGSRQSAVWSRPARARQLLLTSSADLGAFGDRRGDFPWSFLVGGMLVYCVLACEVSVAAVSACNQVRCPGNLLPRPQLSWLKSKNATSSHHFWPSVWTKSTFSRPTVELFQRPWWFKMWMVEINPLENVWPVPAQTGWELWSS